VVVNTDLDGNATAIKNLTAEDTIIDTLNTTGQPPSLDLDGPLTFDGTVLELTGTKTDSLGTKDFPNGPDKFYLQKDDMANLLEENGYYMTGKGESYMVLDIYFSDGLSGDVFTQSELVKIADNVPLGVEGKAYANAKFNGVIQMKDLKAMVEDSVTLVHDASEAEARSLEDYQSADAGTGDHGGMHDTGHGTGHGTGTIDHPGTTGVKEALKGVMDEGEMMMAALSNGEVLPEEPAMVMEEHSSHAEMAMM
jgi:hypothetical protein